VNLSDFLMVLAFNSLLNLSQESIKQRITNFFLFLKYGKLGREEHVNLNAMIGNVYFV